VNGHHGHSGLPLKPDGMRSLDGEPNGGRLIARSAGLGKTSHNQFGTMFVHLWGGDSWQRSRTNRRIHLISIQ
jgi:hypothetical protein